MLDTEATDDRLALRLYGVGRDPVLFLHGFAQTGACGGSMIAELAKQHLVLAPDAPGHGGSRIHAPADLWQTADLLAATVEAEAVGAVSVIGYSFGARSALHLALAHPRLVRSLVLIGGTAGIRGERERDHRRQADERLAAHIEEIGVDAFVEEWLAQPMFEGLPVEATFVAERRSNTAEGLAMSLRRCGTGSMEPLWDRLAAVDVPVLCIAGALDTKYAGLAREMAEAFGGEARVRLVQGAGHAAHLHRPEATTEAVLSQL